MRISTKLATGLMGVGVLAVSFKYGMPTPQPTALTAKPIETAGPATSGVPSSTPTPSAAVSTTTKPAKAPSKSGAGTSNPKPSKPAASGGTTTTTTPVVPPASGGGTVTPASVTKTSDVIYYQYGAIQLSVTENASGAITAINTIQAGATGGRQAAFSSLKTAAISAQGSSFGNVGGATYTSKAFKTALDSAIARF